MGNIKIITQIYLLINIELVRTIKEEILATYYRKNKVAYNFFKLL